MASHVLIPRLFHHHHSGGSSVNKTCPLPSGVEALSIEGTIHSPLLYTASGCLAFVGLSSLGLILFHLTRYRVPQEQRQIVRIVLAPFVFAIVAWAEIYNYRSAAYIHPIGDLYESFCLCAIYLLFIHYASHAAQREAMNAESTPDAYHAPNQTHLGLGIGQRWLWLNWILVFQFPLTTIVATIVLEATQATDTFCVESLRPRFGHLWFEIISSVGVVLCVIAILRFYGRTKPQLKARKAMLKLLSFKLIVILRFVQTWIFTSLVDRNVLKDSTSWSYGDWVYGLPNLVLAIEMVIFSAVFWFAYSPFEHSPFESGHGSSSAGPSRGIVGALFHALDPTDFLLGIANIFGKGQRQEYGVAQVHEVPQPMQKVYQ